MANTWTDDPVALSPRTKWETKTTLIPCWLKEGNELRDVYVKYHEADGMIDLVKIDTMGEPRENFDDLATDFREYFGKDYEFEGLMINELQ